MSAITIQVDTFTNLGWGQSHEAYLDLYNNKLSVIDNEYGSKTSTIANINKLIQEQRPFFVKSVATRTYTLLGKVVFWNDSNVHTRKAIVEKYVLAKLRTFGQDEQPPVKPINVDKLAKLIYYIGSEDDKSPVVSTTSVGDGADNYKPALPTTNELINELWPQETSCEVSFVACAARGICVGQSLMYLFFAAVTPLTVIWQACAEDKWRNCGWTLLDTAIAVLVSPLLCIVKAIQCLLGAIIHPAIALQNPNQKSYKSSYAEVEMGEY